MTSSDFHHCQYAPSTAHLALVTRLPPSDYMVQNYDRYISFQHLVIDLVWA